MVSFSKMMMATMNNNGENGRSLPDGWEWKTVGEVGKTITGNTPPKSDVKNYGDFIPFIKPPELNNGSLWISEDNLSEEGAGLARVVPEKAVLVSCIGNLGKTGIAKRPIAFNQQINAIVFPENILPEFGFYYFQTTEFRKQLEDIASATTISIVNKSKFNSLGFPLAPLPEQERIVRRIEELFSDLDAGVAALERVRAGLKRYKASVLKAACEGKLGIQNDEFRIREDGLPEGWRWTTLPEIGHLGRGKSKHRPRNAEFLYGGKYPFIQTGDIRHANGIITAYTQTYSEAGLAQSKLWKKGTLCITIAANIAETAILGIDACFPDSVVGFVPNDNVEVKFVEFYVRTIKDNLERYAPATAQKNINLDILQKVPVILPPLEEQRRIVAEVERRLSVVGEVESAVEVGLVRAGRLRQSVLRSAFAGRL